MLTIENMTDEQVLQSIIYIKKDWDTGSEIHMSDVFLEFDGYATDSIINDDGCIAKYNSSYGWLQVEPEEVRQFLSFLYDHQYADSNDPYAPHTPHTPHTPA